MSRKRTDEICDLWEADPRQITEMEAITFSLQTIREYGQRLEACEEENDTLENRLEAHPVKGENYLLHFSIPVKVIEQSIAKGGEKDDVAGA